MPIWTNYESKNTADNDDTLLVSDSTSANKLIRQLKISTLLNALKSKLPTASTSTTGIVRLSDNITSTSSTTAATSNAVKTALDNAKTAASTSVAGIVRLSDSTTSTSSTTAATSAAVKNAYDARGSLLYRKIHATGKITFPSAGYAKLTDMTELGLSVTDDYIVAVNIRGWSGGAGALSVAKGSDGETIYGFCSTAASFISVTLEIWYAKHVSV